ncbi:hypothetical protein ABIE58_000218 [Roseovarius sp. MBR-78]|jgi:hypothetical protein
MYRLSIQYSPLIAGERKLSLIKIESAHYEGWVARLGATLWIAERRRKRAL